MTDMRQASRVLVTSRLAFAVALFLLFIALLRAMRPVAPDLHVAGSEADRVTTPTEPAASRAVERTNIVRLVSRDPFSPFRAAPEVAYHISGPVTERPVAVARPVVRLVGTIVRTDGRSFAMCQVANEPVRMIFAGQRIGTLTLETVTQGGAVFLDDTGTRVTLRVARTGE